MGKDGADTILIFDSVTASAGAPGARPLQPRGLADAALAVSERSVEEVQANMTRFIRGLQKILAEGAVLGGELRIEQVEVNAQLTAEGKIGIAGTGVNLKGDTGLKIVFKRAPGQPPVA